MSTFPIQIDARELDLVNFTITELSRSFPTAQVQTVPLEAGRSFHFQIEAGLVPGWTFAVTNEGTVDFDPRFDDPLSGAFLDGRGTDRLTVTGFDVTLDALRCSAGIFLENTTGASFSRATLRLSPSDYQVQQGTIAIPGADDDTFLFGVDTGGSVTYKPELDTTQDGFLAGQGTSTLKFRGYPVLIDARLAEQEGGSPVDGVGISGLDVAFSRHRALFVALLPRLGLPFSLQFRSGPGSDAAFTLDQKGRVVLDSPQIDLQLQVIPNDDSDLPDLRLIKVTGPVR